MSGMPPGKRTIQDPAPPPGNNALQGQNLQYLHQLVDAFRGHCDGLAARYQQSTATCDRLFARQRAEMKELKGKIEKTAAELEEFKKKVEVLEGKSDGNRGGDGRNDDDHHFGGGRGHGPTGNGDAMEMDDHYMDEYYTGWNNNDFNESEGHGDGPNDHQDQDIGGSQGSGSSRESTPNGDGHEDTTGADNNIEQEIKGELESEGLQNPRGSTPNLDETRRRGNGNATPIAPQAADPIAIRDLQVLLETGTAQELLEGVLEYLSKLIPTPNKPGIKEVFQILAKLGRMEQKRMQGALEIAEPEPNNAPFVLKNGGPNDIVFIVRTYEQWISVHMKRTDTISDLKKIVQERTGRDARNLRCFVGEKLIFDFYEVRQTEITDNCVVHVMEGNPDTPNTC